MCSTTTSRGTGGTGSTSAEGNLALAAEYRETLRGLNAKIRALTAQIAETEARKRAGLRYELALLKEMARDARDAIRRLSPPHRLRRRKWGSLDGQSWGRMEYLAWKELEQEDGDSGEERSWMLAVIDDGSETMTARQRQVFCLRYREGLSVGEIASRLGRDRSTIQRTLGRARMKLVRYAEARLLARSCVGEDGRLDLRRFVAETAVLTEVQRETVKLALAGRKGKEIAARLGVQPCTVSRNKRAAEENLAKIVPQIADCIPSRSNLYRRARMERLREEGQDWEKTCKALSSEYGVSLWTVYRLVGGVRRWNGCTALEWRVLQLSEEGLRAAEIARRLGMQRCHVYSVLKSAREHYKREEHGT